MVVMWQKKRKKKKKKTKKDRTRYFDTFRYSLKTIFTSSPELSTITTLDPEGKKKNKKKMSREVFANYYYF